MEESYIRFFYFKSSIVYEYISLRTFDFYKISKVFFSELILIQFLFLTYHVLHICNVY